MFSNQFTKKARKAIYLFFLALILAQTSPCNAQYTLKRYANHPSLERQVTDTEHFNIVYPRSTSELVKKVKLAAENIYVVYEKLLDFEPEKKITLYINRKKQFLSKVHALNTADAEPLWAKNLFFECFSGKEPEWKYLLRHEIAYAFQHKIQSSGLGLWQAFLLSSPAVPLWSAGLPVYLSVPFLTNCDVNRLSDFWNVEMRARQRVNSSDHLSNIILGRSQLLFFNKLFSAKMLGKLYDVRKSFLGIEYFDFSHAFLETFGVPYGFFYNQWKRQQFKIYNDSLPAPGPLPAVTDTLAKPGQTNQIKSVSLDSKSYQSFFNIEIDRPVVLPYYLNTDDFGIGGLASWESPLRLHKFLLAGVLSIPNIADKSFFYTSYINNSFGPRMKLSFKHYTNASGWLDLSVSRSNTVAVSSLWRINALSSDYSNWYIGLMLRYIKVDYFAPFSVIKTESEVVFDNKRTEQTDLRLVLAWRALAAGRHNAIHPLNGRGFRISVTGSGPLLNSKTHYARYYAEAFTLIPTFKKQRIYLYAAGAYDANEPIGADYLYFSDSGDYSIPEPKLMGSPGRAVDAYIRGYKTPIAGERFIWGSIEYRIPLTLDSQTLLFGALPLPRTALALFVDGGALGEARTRQRKGFTAYRFSAGAELKTALSFGGFTIAFKAGIAQALDRPLGPVFYFNIQPAIPF